MSLKTHKENFYFIPTKNKNSLNLYSVENLFQSDFEIMVKIKVNWEDFPSGEEVGGIVSKNGEHMGLFAFTNWIELRSKIIRNHLSAKCDILQELWTTSYSNHRKLE